MRRAARLVTLLTACLALATACGEPRPVTVESAIDTARSQRARAQARAWDAVESAAPYRLRARYNPAACNCPEFEVYYLGSWHRVVLVGSSSTLDALRIRLSGAPRALATAEVLGTPTGAAQRVHERGQLFAVFELEAVLDP